MTRADMRAQIEQLESAASLRLSAAMVGLLRSFSVNAFDLEQPDRLFECGWSWSVVRGAPAVDTVEEIDRQPRGVAQDKPYLYFTVVALVAVEDLFSERTRVLGLLSEEQQRLARASSCDPI